MSVLIMFGIDSDIGGQYIVLFCGLLEYNSRSGLNFNDDSNILPCRSVDCSTYVSLFVFVQSCCMIISATANTISQHLLAL